MSLTQARLKGLLAYDPETGVCRWHVKKGRAQGRDVAGYCGPDGYWRIQVGGKLWLLHRLAWLYMTGEQPPMIVDHIDRDPANNKWANLRAADKSLNNANSRVRRNSTSGVKGVIVRKSRYIAQISINGRCTYLGMFKTVQEASAAYEAAAKTQFGEFARAA